MSDNIEAILFDLDGTLNDLNQIKFSKNFLKLITKKLSEIVAPKIVIKRFLKAYRAVRDNEGKKLNIQVFNDVLFPLGNITKKVGEPLLEKMYNELFPILKSHFVYNPMALEVLQVSYNKGYKIILASDPAAPKSWLIKRLEWSNLSNFPFHFITTIENCRACKSLKNLIYYRQIVDEIKIKESSCLMVGDQSTDMIAAKLGMKTFYVNNKNNKLKNLIPKPTYEGKISDLLLII